MNVLDRMTTSSPLSLRPLNLHWINGTAGEPQDLCAHGDVEFRIHGDLILDPCTQGKSLNVSAAALHLLRTLSKPHTKSAAICGQLFPHCGHAMFDEPEQKDVLIVSRCPAGKDFEVLHSKTQTQTERDHVMIRADDGAEWSVDWSEWRAEVFNFADDVTDFYAASSPKQPMTDVAAAGFRKFEAEWKRRRGKELRR